VQRGILLSYRQVLIRQVQAVAQPGLGPVQPARLSARQVDRAIGLLVEETGDRDRRVTVERRQRCKRAIQAIVGSSVDSRASVIDEGTIGVGTWVGPYLVLAVRVSQSLLQRGLMRVIFERSKLIGSVIAMIGRVADTRRFGGIGSRRREVVTAARSVALRTPGRRVVGYRVPISTLWTRWAHGVGRCRTKPDGLG